MLNKEQLEQYLIDTINNTNVDLEKLDALPKKVYLDGGSNYKDWISKRRSNKRMNTTYYVNATTEEFDIIKSIEHDKNNLYGIVDQLIKEYKLLNAGDGVNDKWNK